MSQKDIVSEAIKYNIILQQMNKNEKSDKMMEKIKEEFENKFKNAMNEVKKQNKESEYDKKLKQHEETLKLESKTLKDLEKQNEYACQCYKSFVLVCILNKDYEQRIEKLIKTNKELKMKDFIIKNNDPKKTLKQSEASLNDKIEQIEKITKKEEKENVVKIFFDSIKKYYDSYETKLIEDKPILITVSFREFFNGFRKRVNIMKNGKKMIYMIVRKPCDQEKTFRIDKQEFRIEIDKNSKWEYIDEKDGCTLMKYYFDKSETTNKSITLPSGKVIVLNAISDGITLEGEGYGKEGKRGKITFIDKEKRIQSN